MFAKKATKNKKYNKLKSKKINLEYINKWIMKIVKRYNSIFVKK